MLAVYDAWDTLVVLGRFVLQVEHFKIKCANQMHANSRLILISAAWLGRRVAHHLDTSYKRLIRLLVTST